MNKLSLYERPIHCTDKKRETIYIKNEEWEKDEGREKTNLFLKKVENYTPDIVTILLPTSPFRASTLIDDSIKLLKKSDATSVVNVVERSTTTPLISAAKSARFPERG